MDIIKLHGNWIMRNTEEAEFIPALVQGYSTHQSVGIFEIILKSHYKRRASE